VHASKRPPVPASSAFICKRIDRLSRRLAVAHRRRTYVEAGCGLSAAAHGKKSPLRPPGTPAEGGRSRMAVVASTLSDAGAPLRSFTPWASRGISRATSAALRGLPSSARRSGPARPTSWQRPGAPLPFRRVGWCSGTPCGWVLIDPWFTVADGPRPSRREPAPQPVLCQGEWLLRTVQARPRSPLSFFPPRGPRHRRSSRARVHVRPFYQGNRLCEDIPSRPIFLRPFRVPRRSHLFHQGKWV
jgi:hypothetical protein